MYRKISNITQLLARYGEIKQVDEPQVAGAQCTPTGPVRLEDQKKLVETISKERQNLQQQNDKDPI